jgi:hypothetical protein
MKQCLVALREGAHFVGEEQLSTASITRMASAIVALFSDPEFVLTQEGFNQIAAERQVMETLFKASIYDGSDFVIALIQPGLEKGLNKYLLLQPTGLEARHGLGGGLPDGPAGDHRPVPLAHRLRAGVHERGPRAPGEAARPRPDLRGREDPGPAVQHAVRRLHALLLRSGRDKHACKRVFHKIIERMLPSVEQVSPGPRARSERPRLLILFEWWWSKHAMFRSYARSIRQLRKDFYLIGCCAGKNTDAEAKTIFDEWIELDGANMVLANIADR